MSIDFDFIQEQIDCEYELLDMEFGSRRGPEYDARYAQIQNMERERDRLYREHVLSEAPFTAFCL